MARESMQERLESLGKKVKKLRDKGAKWGEVTGDLGVAQGKCMLALMYVEEEPNRIKFKNDDDLAKKVVKARESGVSWGLLIARTGQTEGHLRKLWEQETGKSTVGERIGKGGRRPGGTGGGKPKAGPKAKGTKSAAATKAAAAKEKAGNAPAKKRVSKPKLDVMTADLDALVEALEGKKIKVLNSKTKKEQTFGVKTVKGADDSNIEIVDAKSGGTRTFAREAIKAVSGR